jgi:hypothetical protein
VGADGEGGAVAGGESDARAEGGADTLLLPLRRGDSDAPALPEGDSDTRGEGDAAALLEGEADARGEALAEGLRLPRSEGEGLPDAERVPSGEGVHEGVPLSLAASVAAPLPVGGAVAELRGVRDVVAVWDA